MNKNSKLTKTGLLFLLLHFCMSVNAQKISPLDSLFIGGDKNFYKTLAENSKYPSLTKSKDYEGFLITQFMVKKEGGVEMRFMTKIDKAVESMMINSLEQIADQWINLEEAYTVYLPVCFNIGTSIHEDLGGKVDSFMNKYSYPFLGLIMINSYIRYNSGSKLNKYEKLLKGFQDQLEKGKTDKAYKIINEIIRYNPFDIKLIQQRVRLEKELGKDEYRKYDVPWISVLMELEKSGFNGNKKP